MNVETYIPADSCATQVIYVQAEPTRQVIHDGKTFTQLRCNTDTWTFDGNYHHNTVAHDEINDRHEGIIGRLAEMQPKKGNNGTQERLTRIETELK
ncbi:uncharacterized protein LOC105434265 isoform X4 [Pogonomyrmex barbatus]|uniref:Uncharacterized protein LOC105434265 isoform X4 n=1 Tax=Pogonomyrmex barbatus TaxID=144034 RepID=A0A8N1SCE9_9HYME|nr:uncharacterized protein LOC105434265 isoform X4 [Pogonomyrmex barbatus]